MASDGSAPPAPALPVPGTPVRAVVTGEHPWGATVRVLGYEGVPASIDAAAMESPSGSRIALPEERLRVGEEVAAVVQQLRQWSGPGRVRLSTRAADLAGLRWRCDFCMADAVLSPGGDGVVMEVRAAGGPGAHSVVAHRDCLLGALHPESLERARVPEVGRGG
ncbi:hypothetical protein J0910_02910 [Nocardiopsis sp. CNT-189]|uniref:hypothetical protein n=1 Tax=Nocardiopsis oceanisediminis TaxID=2816862 RepID=UPI003B327779